MTVNKEKLITLLAEIEKAESQLEEYAALEESAILSSTERLNSLKYLLIVAIEACVDVCQHLSAKLFSEVPESYTKCFLVLGKHNVTSNSLAEGMAKFAGLRNLLVHRYWQVDDTRVVGELKNIGTFHEYAKTVAGHVGLTLGGVEQ
jgi:uncharacterized protein YutE (UPF0331/DUF86 family)